MAALDQMIRAKKVLAICLTSDLSLSPVLRYEELVIAEGDAGPGLDVAAQQPPLWMFRCTAFGGVLGFVLVVVRLVIFDDVILATEQGNDTCDKKTMIISQQYLFIFRLGFVFIFTSVPANYTHNI